MCSQSALCPDAQTSLSKNDIEDVREIFDLFDFWDGRDGELLPTVQHRSSLVTDRSADDVMALRIE